MTDNADFPNRRFQLWRYTVSHRHVLLRSTKRNPADTRVDIAFKDVALLCLPTILDGLSTRVVSAESIGLGVSEQMVGDRTVYLIDSQSGEGPWWIVAGAIFVAEDQKEYLDPSAVFPAETL